MRYLKSATCNTEGVEGVSVKIKFHLCLPLEAASVLSS